MWNKLKFTTNSFGVVCCEPSRYCIYGQIQLGLRLSVVAYGINIVFVTWRSFYKCDPESHRCHRRSHFSVTFWSCFRSARVFHLLFPSEIGSKALKMIVPRMRWLQQLSRVEEERWRRHARCFQYSAYLSDRHHRFCRRSLPIHMPGKWNYIEIWMTRFSPCDSFPKRCIQYARHRDSLLRFTALELLCTVRRSGKLYDFISFTSIVLHYILNTKNRCWLNYMLKHWVRLVVS